MDREWDREISRELDVFFVWPFHLISLSIIVHCLSRVAEENWIFGQCCLLDFSFSLLAHSRISSHHFCLWNYLLSPFHTYTYTLFVISASQKTFMFRRWWRLMFRWFRFVFSCENSLAHVIWYTMIIMISIKPHV